MIRFDPASRVFELRTGRSFYACAIDGDGHLIHLAWAPVPEGVQGPIASTELPRDVRPAVGLDRQGRRDEVMTLGSHAYREVALALEFPRAHARDPERDAEHAPLRDLRLSYADHEIAHDGEPGGAPRHGRPTRVTTPRETLRIRLVDRVQGFEVVACYRVTPEHDLLERWLELANTGSDEVRVDQLFWGSVHLDPGPWELLQATGGWAAEFGGARVPLAPGTHLLESRSVHTGFLAHPFFLLARPGRASEEAGPVWFGQLAWSGAWRLSFEQRPNGALCVHGGDNPFDFELRLAPGARHVTPAWILGCCEDGFGGASRRMHAFLRERVLPLPDTAEPELRPVLYNSWEATYFDIDEAGQIELARRAAELGVELFCLDDGWFGSRRDDTRGLGDWQVGRDVLPNGLEPLIREVRKLGMRFGLWVEPEMVNPDSELCRAHPDWVLHWPGRPRTEERHQWILDLGRREVVEHLYGVLHALLAEHEIDFLKWDMNRFATEPGSVAGRGIWRAHAHAVYELMDRLRAAFPHLAIETCSSGGGRIDAGILARTDQFWTSDNTDALTRVDMQETCSLAYPARAMACWVTHERNHQTGRVLPLGLRFDVAMRGVLGIGSDLRALDADERAEYARWIAFYKQIRRVVQTGDLYRLQLRREAGTSIVQYVLPDASESVVSTVSVERRLAEVVPRARLRGLDPGARYVATTYRGREYARASGAELLARGLEPDLGVGQFGPGYSRTLHLVRES